MVDGVIQFPRPEDCTVKKEIRQMRPKVFTLGQNLQEAEAEALQVGV